MTRESFNISTEPIVSQGGTFEPLETGPNKDLWSARATRETRHHRVHSWFEAGASGSLDRQLTKYSCHRYDRDRNFSDSSLCTLLGVGEADLARWIEKEQALLALGYSTIA